MFGKIENYFRKKELNKTGVFIGEITEGKPHMRALICLLRGFMIFLGTYGALVGLLRAFELPFNILIVTPFLFFVSVFLAFLYFHKIIFYTGYFLLLGTFTFELGYMYLYANSGYQAIVNTIYLAYSDYFKLLSVREGQEMIVDRTTTVTVAVIFIGTFLAMMLNVTISGYMNLWESVLVSFPFLEIAFFINKKPPIYCVCMVLAMYIFVGILQASRHQRMQVKGKYTHEYTRFSRKNKKYYFYQGNLKGNFLTMIFAILASVLICIIAYPAYRTQTEYLVHNPVRTKVDEYAKIYVQSGFSGFLNRYDSTGGMNSGRLGGVGEVRPDFQTDLSVTFAPYSFNTVYLKGFTGTFYLKDQWFNTAFSPPTEEFLNPGMFMENAEIQKLDAGYFPQGRASARMNIVNLDADSSYSYLPYFTDFTKYGNFSKAENSSLDLENGVDITYEPFLDLFYDVPKDYRGISDPDYEHYVNQCCTYVPDPLHEQLQDYILENNFFDSGVTGFTEEENAGQFRDVNDYRLTMARKIYAHYMQNFQYTMSPGATPYSRDYVEYFLTTQRRGYCAHFASSGVMLLRTMGIPARYVEGYCIPPSLLAERGTGVAEEYDEWYEGDTLLEEKGVVNVPVSDAFAHAWIEIYMEGYGFLPFEMTIPSDDEEPLDMGGFGDLFSGLFNIRLQMAELPDPNANNTANNLNTKFMQFFNFDFDYRKFVLPLAIGTGVILLALFGFLGIRFNINKRRLKKLYDEGAYGELVYINYSKFTDFLNSKAEIRTSGDNPLPADILEQLKRILPGRAPGVTEESLEQLFAYIERSMYSNNPGTKEEYDSFVNTLDSIRTFIRKN